MSGVCDMPFSLATSARLAGQLLTSSPWHTELSEIPLAMGFITSSGMRTTESPSEKFCKVMYYKPKKATH